MADATWAPSEIAGAPARHPLLVRVTHWVSAACFFALLVSGANLVISHPRFYWGETGNVNTSALFQIPIPSSRGAVQTGYGFVLPDQNGWSRALHFQAAWVAVLAGTAYFAGGLLAGHFRRRLIPSPVELRRSVVSHLRFEPQVDAGSYNPLQRLTYLVVVFGLAPLMLWTGVAMSPTFTAGFPGLVTSLGGHQTARTLHFFAAIALLLFVVVHLVMIGRAGFWRTTRAMVSGRAATEDS